MPESTQAIFMKRTSLPFRHTAVAAVVGLGFLANAAWAVTPFVVKDVKVEGLQRVDAGTVFASIPVKVGETYDDDKGSAAIRALYSLGLFSDVKVETRGSDVIVVVQERPTINEVTLTSVDAFDKKLIMAGLAGAGVAAGRPFDKAAEDLAVQELKRQYEGKGYYGTEVVTTVTPIDRNRVNVNFTVHEGASARIRSIRFVGNQAFSESTLRGQMEQDTGGWMSWYTKSNRYSQQRLNSDLEAVRSYYLNRGYLEFKVDSTQVALSPDKRDIDITVNVTEGPKYVVSGVSLAGNFLDKEDEFSSLVKVKPGEAYKADDVAATVKAMTDRFGNYGFAFAKVTPQPSIDRERQQVALVFTASPDQRAYVRRINVAGNTKTRDEVIRRELRQFESSWYDADKIKLSRDRVDRLGYFNEVTVDTTPVPGTSDQADLTVAVKERPTGSLQIGAGYSSTDKVSLSAGVSQDNIFGSGQSLSAEINTSKYNRSASISSVDPYFTTDGVSRIFNAFYNRYEPYASQGSGVYDYRIQQLGGNVSFGIPFTERDTVYFGGGFEQYKIQPGTSATIAEANKLTHEQREFIEQNNGKSSAYGIPLTIGWSRDSRDSSLAPTTGMYQRLSGAVSPMGDLKYALANYRFQYYYPLSKQYTLAFNTDLAYGKGLGNKEFPFFKNFYSGGLGSVRGFDQGALGPKREAYDGSTYSVGGNKMFNVNLELITPFPGAGNEKTLRMFGFVDAGNVYSDKPGAYDNTANSPELNKYAKKVRVSAGAGIRWLSPMGPLSLAFGFPIKKYEGDKLQKVQFQIGTTF
jgi:outer membrane protein insertion porin family